MLRTIACPKETDLLALAAGDEPSAGLLAHLDSCPSCRGLIRRLRIEIARLRSSCDSVQPSSTASGPKAPGGDPLPPALDPVDRP